jgi:hypothetical protein
LKFSHDDFKRPLIVHGMQSGEDSTIAKEKIMVKYSKRIRMQYVCSVY